MYNNLYKIEILLVVLNKKITLNKLKSKNINGALQKARS